MSKWLIDAPVCCGGSFPSAVGASGLWKCWFPSYFLRYVSTPVFVVNSDIDPVALVIGQQMSDFSFANYVCLFSILSARGKKPFCSTAIFSNSTKSSSSRAIISTSRPSLRSLGVGSVMRHLWRSWWARSSELEDPIGNYRSCSSASRMECLSYLESTAPALDRAGRQQLQRHLSRTANVTQDCPTASPAAIDAYGRQVCASTAILLRKRWRMAGFIVSRMTHVLTGMDSWGTVKVNGISLADAVTSWWMVGWPRTVFPS